MKRRGIAPSLSTLFALALLAGAPFGCNTIEGAGEDLEAGGEAIQDVADDDE